MGKARPSNAPAPTATANDARVAAGAPSLEQMEPLVAALDRLLVAALCDEGASYRDRASVAAAKTSALRVLSSLRGETQASEAAIVGSRVFRRAMRGIEEALTGFPEAAGAVAKKFEELYRNGD